MRALALATPLLRLGLLAGLACLANAVLAGSYTPPTPPPSPARHRYPVGYDPDRRARPYAFPAKHVLLSKPAYPPSSPTHPTRGEAKALRWAAPVGYDPRRRPTLRRTDSMHSTGSTGSAAAPDPPRADTDCPMPDCKLDPTRHLCTGIWMGRAIIDRRCLKIEI